MEMLVDQAVTGVDGPAVQSQSEQAQSHKDSGSVQQTGGSGSRRISDAASASSGGSFDVSKTRLLAHMLDPNDVDDPEGFESFEHEEDEAVRQVSEGV